MVEVDLRHLSQDFHAPVPFAGGLDLAKLAKERHVISDARAGLSELCATVLHRRLDKNRPERVSVGWNDATLTEEQVSYAALDAYASLAVYKELIKVDAPGRLPSGTPLPSLPVLLYSTDNTRLIARGVISPRSSDARYDGISLTDKRTVVTVHEVLVPGAVVTTHQQRTLDSFGSTPFDVVCLRSHLRTYSPSTDDQVTESPHNDHPTTHPPSPSLPASNPEGRESAEAAGASQSAHAADLEECSGDEDMVGLGTELLEERQGRQAADAFQDISGLPGAVGDGSLDQSMLSSFEVDSDGALLAQELLESMSQAWDAEFPIRSRVLKDPWHVFNMLYISRTHGLRVSFARALRDAIFIPDKGDKARICRYLATLKPPRDWDYALRTAANWLWKRCKRLIPPPELLYSKVAHVFRTYGPLKDAKTGLPLFNKAAWHTAKNILSLVQLGYLSDPPGIPLYYSIGIDTKCGLPIYRCIRGTNWTEGGVHRHLRTHLPTSGVSPRHMLTCLYDFILRHNLLVRHTFPAA